MICCKGSRHGPWSGLHWQRPRGEGALTRYGLEEYVADCVILLDNRNWSQNVLNGPPLPAPPSSTGLALAGLAALSLQEAAGDAPESS
jgi:hypothetical protein